MCGLFGVIAPHAPDLIEPRIVCALAILNEERGRHALGVMTSNGSIWKRAGNPRKLITDPSLARWYRHNSADNWAILGHTRQSTCRNADRDDCAHPFTSNDGRYTLAHNGVITAPAKYDVDSQHLVELLASADGNYQGAWGEVSGTFATVARYPDGTIQLCAIGNQIHYCEVRDPANRERGLVYYSSDLDHLRAGTLARMKHCYVISDGCTVRFGPGLPWKGSSQERLTVAPRVGNSPSARNTKHIADSGMYKGGKFFRSVDGIGIAKTKNGWLITEDKERTPAQIKALRPEPMEDHWKALYAYRTATAHSAALLAGWKWNGTVLQKDEFDVIPSAGIYKVWKDRTLPEKDAFRVMGPEKDTVEEAVSAYIVLRAACQPGDIVRVTKDYTTNYSAPRGYPYGQTQPATTPHRLSTTAIPGTFSSIDGLQIATDEHGRYRVVADKTGTPINGPWESSLVAATSPYRNQPVSGTCTKPDGTKLERRGARWYVIVWKGRELSAVESRWQSPGFNTIEQATDYFREWESDMLEFDASL